MDSERWGLISRLYHEALALDTDRRASFLADACHDDETLRASVLSLLSHLHRDNIPDVAQFGHTSATLTALPSMKHRTEASEITRLADDGRRSEHTRFAPGQLIASRFRIVRLLGHGGMGEVYQADDLTLGERVALKLLAPGLAHHPGAIDRFVTEVRLARAIAHPNVCRVYDIGEFDGLHYLSMEYVDGETLSSLLRRVGTLPPDAVANIARQLCAGLAAAHGRGVLHRDLKPANIMMDGQGYVRILDFGLAVQSTGIRAPDVAGTPQYMAPEQLVGGHVSERTDLYAFGLVIQELLTGSPARWYADSEHIDNRFAPIIRRCLEFDPNRRPASVAEVAVALPGKDIIETAIEAGRTLPAPMLAAAGADRGLSRKIGGVLLASALIGVLVVAEISSRFTIRPSQLPRSPTGLAQEARLLLQRMATGPNEFDDEYWFEPTAISPRLRFVYRQSPQSLIPRNIFRSVTTDDPPADVDGMVTVTLNTEGRLLSFEAVSNGASEREQSEPDWRAFFQAAGLNIEQFAQGVPRVAPLLPHDEVLSWQPKDDAMMTRAGDLPSVVTAALVRHVPTLFSTDPLRIPVANRDPLDSKRGKLLETFLSVLIVLGFVSSAFLARRHVRMQDADRQGARRVAFAIATGGILLVICRAHHGVDPLSEWFLLLGGSGWALIWAAFSWLTYIGLEPYARRWWPNTLASWTSVLEGRVWEPIVGRDVLIGLNAGCLTVALLAARFQLTGASTPDLYLTGALESVRSWQHWVGALAFCATDALEFAIGGLFVLVLIRLLLRKSWLAISLWMCLVMPVAFGVFSLRDQAVLWDVLFAVAIGGLAAIVMLRVGLLAAFTMIAVEHLSTRLLLTLEPTVWYFRYSVVVVVGLAALSLVSYLTATTEYHSLKAVWRGANRN
jgi:hypothetical protein